MLIKISAQALGVMRLGAVVPLLLLSCAGGIRLPDRQQLFELVDPSVAISFDSLRDTLNQVGSEQHYGPLVVDNDGDQLLVGMRNGLLRLDLQNLTELENWTWQPSSKDVSLCQMKGRSNVCSSTVIAELCRFSNLKQCKPITQFECGNFIRAITRLPDGRLLVCGTHAFAPKCTRVLPRALGAGDKLFGADPAAPTDVLDGVGAVPYDPAARGAHVLTSDGQFIAGTQVDFTGTSSAVLRFWPQDKLLQTERNDVFWLNDPEFINAFEIGNFVYILFMETALEQCGERRRVARVARVCANDVGGDVLLPGTWVTFAKATMACRAHYGNLVHASLSDDHETVVAAFTSEKDAIDGSVVCVYNVDDLRKVFSGDYLYQVDTDGTWKTHSNPQKYFDCGVRSPTSQRPGASVRREADAQRYQLIDGTWLPRSGQPAHVAPLMRYSRVVVDKVRTKNGGQSLVVFAISNVGLVDKLVIDEAAGSTCLVQVLQALKPHSAERVTDAVINRKASTIYLSTESLVIRLPAHQCDHYGTRDKCETSPDPYCGWDSQLAKCSTAPDGVVARHWWKKAAKTKCATLGTEKVDGGFSEWSEWKPCPKVDTGDAAENATRSCMCRTRQCNNPRPTADGKPCVGADISVSKCKRDGRWTDWSSWSSCSSTCSTVSAARQRTRTCTNPSPTHGGQPCVGKDTEEDTCPSVPECPPVLPDPIDGGWTAWSAWTQCTHRCGGGIRSRSRACTAPAPRHAGAPCSGCHEQHATCNAEPCPHGGRTASVMLSRYKFACLANIDHPSLLAVSQPRSEQKQCQNGFKDCLEAGFLPVDGYWSEWGAWSQCSQQCGDHGKQMRSRRCDSPAPANGGLYCAEHAVESRACNRMNCAAQWSCWSELTPCSATCGRGARERVRTCDRHPLQTSCEGGSSEITECYAGPCPDNEGFGSWSEWSLCDNQRQLRTRLRSCIDLSLCGHLPAEAYYDICDTTYDDSNAVAPVTQGTWRIHEQIIFACSIAFTIGLVVASLVICCAFRIAARRNRKESAGRNSSSPAGTHQSSLPPTLYTPVPMNGSNKSAMNLYTPPPDEPTVFANSYCRSSSNPASSLLGATNPGGGGHGGSGSSGDEEIDLIEHRSTPSSVAPSVAASSRLTRGGAAVNAHSAAPQPVAGAAGSYMRLPTGAGRPGTGAVSPLDQLIAVVRQNGLAGSKDCCNGTTQHLSRLNMAAGVPDEPVAAGGTLRRAVRASMHSKDFL